MRTIDMYFCRCHSIVLVSRIVADFCSAAIYTAHKKLKETQGQCLPHHATPHAMLSSAATYTIPAAVT